MDHWELVGDDILNFGKHCLPLFCFYVVGYIHGAIAGETGVYDGEICISIIAAVIGIACYMWVLNG